MTWTQTILNAVITVVATAFLTWALSPSNKSNVIATHKWLEVKTSDALSAEKVRNWVTASEKALETQGLQSLWGNLRVNSSVILHKVEIRNAGEKRVSSIEVRLTRGYYAFSNRGRSMTSYSDVQTTQSIQLGSLAPDEVIDLVFISSSIGDPTKSLQILQENQRISIDYLTIDDKKSIGFVALIAQYAPMSEILIVATLLVIGVFVVLAFCLLLLNSPKYYELRLKIIDTSELQKTQAFIKWVEANHPERLKM